MIAVGIDPGDKVSAYVMIDTHATPIVAKGIIENEKMLILCKSWGHCKVLGSAAPDVLCVEKMVSSYDGKIGMEVLNTMFWAGRFVEAWGDKFEMIARATIKARITGRSSAKDKHVRAKLIEKYGGQAKAIGKKKIGYGPLHGVKEHEWQALAAAVYYVETRNSFKL